MTMEAVKARKIILKKKPAVVSVVEVPSKKRAVVRCWAALPHSPLSPPSFAFRHRGRATPVLYFLLFSRVIGLNACA
jgi:hypothetical protein